VPGLNFLSLPIAAGCVMTVVAANPVMLLACRITGIMRLNGATKHRHRLRRSMLVFFVRCPNPVRGIVVMRRRPTVAGVVM
jgi:hypothetical protein